MNECVLVQFSDHPLSVEEATRFVSDDSCGAISVFVGVTRKDRSDQGIVAGLEFETHVPLATAVMNDILDEYMQN